MSIRYAPYIEGTIPAFGTTLLVPYEMNRGVKLTDNITFVVKIMDLNNNNIKYFTTYDAKLNPLPFTVSELTAGQYYKIQLAYSDGEENNKLIYSSIGIGKYFGNTAPTITNSNDSTYNSINYDANDSGEELYSLIITNSNNKDLQELYIEQNQLSTGVVNLAMETRNVKAKTINSYITDSVYLEPSTAFDEKEIINEFLKDTDNENIYLIDKNKTLCVKFNPKISSFKTTIQETKTDTIGGKYPMFYRNGTLGYKEFPVNGLISYHMDENEKFMTKAELGLETEESVRAKTASGESAAALNTPTHNLVEYNIVAERKFRNAVLDWLNNGEVKLFKSPTEGMFLVRLMNISLSPEEKLGRMLYSFSATAYEVGEVNYENLVKYGFIDKIEGVDYVVR